MYPPYADQVEFIAVGIDPSEGPDVLRAYQQAQGYPWSVAMGDREMLQRYNVVSTSIKYAVNKDGIITHQRGYGVEDAQTWERVFQGLLQ